MGVLPVNDVRRKIMLVSEFGFGLGKYICFNFAFSSYDTIEAYLN
jgi:hypothetical protein